MKSAIEFRANGKLLITGEYLVLAGTLALALPVRFGQKMFIHETVTQMIDWESMTPGGTWFKARFDPETLNIISTDDTTIALGLKKLLLATRLINPDFLSGTFGWNVKVVSDYPLEWGLGSSSTLCSLVARWAGVNTYDLFRMVSQGSGYDVACAEQSSLLLYQLRNNLPEITFVKPGKAIRENTSFVYLGNKQNSASEVASFLNSRNYNDHDVTEGSKLSSEICIAESPEELIFLVKKHESLLATILKREPISVRFPSFPGTVKSLGAWGGDFAMFVSATEPEKVKDHLHGMGFSTIFSYNDLEIKS
jgi:mevalonate kinase